jgi:cyclopropane fatty-acyl-phospholipid synthase-like methyltransferase
LEAYDNLVLASASSLPFRKNSFDTLIAPELIEHMSKEDGDRFLRQASEIGDKIVITSPGRLFNVTSEIKSEHHVSYWSQKEFRNYGFSTEKHDEIIIAFTSK